MLKFLLACGLAAVSSIDVVGTMGCTATNCVFANQYLRFGSGVETSVNAWGLFVQPWYYSTNASTWYKLTFSSFPLDTAIGSGYGSTHWSGASIVDIYSLTSRNSTTDYSGFIVDKSDTTKTVGYGRIIANRTFIISGNLIMLQNIFSLGRNDSYVKIVSSIINVGVSDINNVIIWTGTRDDYVGNTDSNTKVRGNLNTGSFVPVTYNNQSSRAIMIKNTNEGVLFYSETPGVMTSYSVCCSFANAYNAYPLSLPPMTLIPTDGSYAAVLPIGNVSRGSGGSITWYYAAGVISALTTVAQSVAAAQLADVGIPIPTSTATWTWSVSGSPTGSGTSTGSPSKSPESTPNIPITIKIYETVTFFHSDAILYIVGFVPVLSLIACLCCIGICYLRRTATRKPKPIINNFGLHLRDSKP